MPDEGFLARWSRRKAQAESGVPAVAPQADLLPEGTRESNEACLPPSGAGAGVEAPADEQAAPPPPTLDDVAHLNPESDFRRFIAPTVDPTVKNAALKKLFADPHFNAMDGLDVYIDDYGQPNPIPAALLRQLVQARGLGLFDQERSPDQASPDGAASARAPESAKEVPAVPPDEDPDLQLQQDDAAGRGGAEERPPA
jgi:hypothetical protein